MKKGKLQKLAMAAVLLSTIGSYSFAADNASVTVSGTLAGFLNVTGNTPAAGTIDTSTGAMTSPPTATFQISTNQKNRNMELIARVTDSTAAAVNAFFQDAATDNYIILGNTTVAERPTAAAIADCSAVTPTTTTNENCIAYKLGTVQYNSVTLPYSIANQRFTFLTVKGTNKAANVPLTATPRTDTYSLEDSEGTYSAVVTCQTYTP